MKKIIAFTFLAFIFSGCGGRWNSTDPRTEEPDTKNWHSECTVKGKVRVVIR